MKEAIQKAIEGGYKNYVLCSEHGYEYGQVWLDPLFWQALVKSMGWDDLVNYWTCLNSDGTSKIYLNRWENEMHNFIDHLAKGKDTEEFFNNLINNKQ